jgi:hypothetical protein
VGEPVVLEAVLPGLCDEIADKANARGWCDCRSPAAPLLPLRNEDLNQDSLGIDTTTSGQPLTPAKP